MPPDNSNSMAGVQSSILAIAQAISNQSVTFNSNPYKARAYAGAVTGLGVGTDTKVALNTKSFDTNTNFDTTNSRYVAPANGYYSVKGNVAISCTGSAHNSQLRVNGALVSIGEERANTPAGTNQFPVADDLYLNKGDYVELYAFNSGGAVNTVSGVFRCYLSVFIISLQ